MPRRAKGRANGEGSIYEYPKGSGIWYAQIRLEDGTPKRKRAGTQREARETLRALQRDREQGVNLAAQQPTLAQWCTTATDLVDRTCTHYGCSHKPHLIQPKKVA
jgi:hypothetical protein